VIARNQTRGSGHDDARSHSRAISGKTRSLSSAAGHCTRLAIVKTLVRVTAAMIRVPMPTTTSSSSIPTKTSMELDNNAPDPLASA